LVFGFGFFGFASGRYVWVCMGPCWHPRLRRFVARAVWFGLVWFGLVWFAWVFAGIRDALSRSTRRPCAGRHLLFFAAAKKSRQKKAAHTANS
jgi:hypothetical protein